MQPAHGGRATDERTRHAMVAAMCHPSILAFGAAHLSEAEIRDRAVLEVGSRVVQE